MCQYPQKVFAIGSSLVSLIGLLRLRKVERFSRIGGLEKSDGDLEFGKVSAKYECT